ncbi:helix-turn-helix transcriptional regulator [Gordonia amicalis]|uniref:helix-turn-helix domain-containing protein n=1 Tax=Gordonia amicalis TaxID=89053 RepID=UPI00295463F3|nr:helix-turn-helix transcriptional regulator [Gordonia amicalis]MDV7101648.1 helix-turn-helix transcriptional regulator [Gordonia amicalis]
MPNNREAATRGSADAKAWALEGAARFGRAVGETRREQGLSALELSGRTADLGYPITRSTIARIEGNHRAGKVDFAEVVVLAAALGVPPIQLIYPDQPAGEVEFLPNARVTSIAAAEHFSGEASLPGELRATLVRMQAARRYEELRSTISGLARMQLLGTLKPEDEAKRQAAQAEMERLRRDVESRRQPFYWGVSAEQMNGDDDG